MEDLPLLEVREIEKAKRLFILMEATGWRFLPSQISGEDESMLNDLLQFKAALSSLRSQQAEDRPDNKIV